MSNTELFKQTFNDIEDTLKKIVEPDRHLRFSLLVDKAAKINTVVASFKTDLIQYGELRNSIVHSSTKRYLADPLDETVANIQQLLDKIKNPATLEQFKNQKIMICYENDSLNETLIKMKKSDFSQVPIYKENKLIGLLTTDTISRWLAFELETNKILEDTTVEIVMKQKENADNYKILSRKNLVLDAIRVFEKCFNEGHNISAILITETGNEKETPLGIITLSDIPKMEMLVRLI